KLPTENELTQTLSLSYGTIQKAYQILELQGFAVRYRGSGSYVSHSTYELKNPWHCRFLDEDNNELPIFPKIIGSEKNKDIETQALNAFGDDTDLGRIDRILYVRNEFAIFSRFYSTKDIIDTLLRLSNIGSYESNFKYLLLHEFGRPIASIE